MRTPQRLVGQPGPASRTLRTWRLRRPCSRWRSPCLPVPQRIHVSSGSWWGTAPFDVSGLLLPYRLRGHEPTCFAGCWVRKRVLRPGMQQLPESRPAWPVKHGEADGQNGKHCSQPVTGDVGRTHLCLHDLGAGILDAGRQGLDLVCGEIYARLCLQVPCLSAMLSWLLAALALPGGCKPI